MIRKRFALALAPLALLALAGCPAAATDTGDNGIQKMTPTKTNTGMPSAPGAPSDLKVGTPTGK